MKIVTMAVAALASGGDLLADSACSDRSVEQWQAWLNLQASRYPGIDYQEVSRTMESCGEYFAANGLTDCMQNLAGFARVQVRASSRDMGFVLPNREYLAAQPQELMRLPDEFRDGLPSGWQEIARDRGWKYFSYASRTVGNPPNTTFGRLLFLIESETHDRWIQFTYSDSLPERLIDLIAIQKKVEGKTLVQPKIHFRQYWRDDNGRNPELRVQTGDNCYSCHPGGMRRLSPEPGSLRPIDFVAGDDRDKIGSAENLPFYRLNEYNAKMRSYGQVDWGDTIVPESHGPAMGTYTVPARNGRSARTVSCGTCHDGASRGVINASTAPDHVEHKLAIDLSMPPNSTIVPALEKRLMGMALTQQEERQLKDAQTFGAELYQVVQSQYPNEVRAWLSQNRCK